MIFASDEWGFAGSRIYFDGLLGESEPADESPVHLRRS